MNDTSKNSDINLEPLIRLLVKEWRSTPGEWAKVERIAELEEENARLEQENGELTEEQDRVASMFRTAHEESAKYQDDIETLKAELRGCRAENDRLEEVRHEDSAEIQVLLDRIERLREESDVYLEDVGFWAARWKEAADQRDQYHADLDRLQRAVPRVIEPSEVRKGQVVAYTPYHVPDRWTVREFSHDQPFHPSYYGSVILLRDAASEEADEGDDFPCCRIAQTGICEDVE